MGEQGIQEGADHLPLWVPVLRIREGEVLFSTFTTCGQPVRKSRTQLHRAGFRPWVLSLMMILEDTMVLKSEL